METASPPAAPALSSRVFWILFLLIAGIGIALRVADTASFRRTGFDELIYRRYVYLMDGGKQSFAVPKKDKTEAILSATINQTGAMATPALSQIFLETQKDQMVMCELPPTRFLYIYTAWVWKNIKWGDAQPLDRKELMAEKAARPPGDPYAKDASRRDPALASLNQVACGFSILLMLAGGLFAWRMLGHAAGLGVLALMAVDPLQLHLSQHAMVDGFFAFWGLMCVWTTWECLRNPASKGWLVGHGVCLALMVMTKENAFFVYCGLALVVASNRWLKFGTVTSKLLLTSIVGPLAGLSALVALAGGVEEFMGIYKTLVLKAQDLEYARLTGDGPWYRYLVDLITISPIILCLALGALFALSGQRKELAFLAVFVAATYLIMCNVRYGMNLRYTSVWGMPLRFAAFLMIWQLCSRFQRAQWAAATVAIAGLCTYELRQYAIFATDNTNPFYETVPNDMLRRVNIIKSPEAPQPAPPVRRLAPPLAPVAPKAPSGNP